MQRTLLGLMLMVSLAFAGACGGDDNDNSGDSTGGTSATGGTAATGGTTVEPVMCGDQTCMGVPGFAEPCCDDVNSLCGVSVGGECMTAGVPDDRCPSAGFDMIVPPCCQEDTNLCGVSVAGNCTDLATAAGFAAGLGVTLPDPVDCDGNPVEPMTGGMAATGGMMGTGGNDEDAGM